MKVTIVGATGQIGRKVVNLLKDAGHHTIAATRGLGVNALTGEGLADALAGADVLLDVTNPSTLDPDAAMSFFTRSSTNLVAAAREAGVGHCVVLSIVGVHALPGSGYMRGKVAQERTVAHSGLPYTIVRATQFHEFAAAIVATLTSDGAARVPKVLIQPVAADEVAAQISRVAVSNPLNGIVNVGGPEKLSFADMARLVLASRREATPVTEDPAATYFGASLQTSSLVTDGSAVIGDTRLADWLAANAYETAPRLG